MNKFPLLVEKKYLNKNNSRNIIIDELIRLYTIILRAAAAGSDRNSAFMACFVQDRYASDQLATAEPSSS